MNYILNKCLKPDTEGCNNNNEADGYFPFCGNIDDIHSLQTNSISENRTNRFNKNIAFKNVKNKNGLSGAYTKEVAHMNEYRENNFNYMFGIDNIEFPIHVYQHIFYNFFTSFINEKSILDKETEKEGEPIVNETERTEGGNLTEKEKEICKIKEGVLEQIPYEDIHVISKLYNSLKREKYVLLHKANSAPHQKKQIIENYKNGDALICCDNIIAIADGVSSISNLGINVSNFSNNILRNCLNLHLHKCINYEQFVKENEIIYKMYNLKYNEKEILKPLVCRSACSANFLGASTLLFAALENNQLHICNIGDSQMLIIRLKRMCLNLKYLRKIKLKVLTPGEIFYFVKEKYKNFKDVQCIVSSNLKNMKTKRSDSKEENKKSSRCRSRGSAVVNGHSENAYFNGPLKNRIEPAKGIYDYSKENVRNDFGKNEEKTQLSANEPIEKNKSNEENELINTIIKQKHSFIKSVSIIESLQSLHSKESKVNSTIGSNETYFNIVNDIYANKQNIYNNNILNNLKLNKNEEVKSTVFLYMEKQLKRKKERLLKKYLKSHNYKIGSLLFELEDIHDNYFEDTIENEHMLSTSTSSGNTSLVNPERMEEKTNIEAKKENLKNQEGIYIDNSGMKNLLNFFNIDATNIPRGQHYSSSTETESLENYNKSKNENNNVNAKIKKKLESETGTCNLSFNNKNTRQNRDRKNANEYNNYRFRFKEQKTGIFDIIYKSKIQQHHFNCPYQISSLPKYFHENDDRVSNNNNNNNNNNSSNNSNSNNSSNNNNNNSNISNNNINGMEEINNREKKNKQTQDLYMNSYNSIFAKCLRNCKYSIVNIKNNDIIISGSDGVFDNLYDDDIVEIIFNNFYILKYNKFINLKEVFDFYRQYDDFNKNFKNNIMQSMSTIKTSANTESSANRKSSNHYFSQTMHNKLHFSIGSCRSSSKQNPIQIVKEAKHGSIGREFSNSSVVTDTTKKLSNKDIPSVGSHISAHNDISNNVEKPMKSALSTNNAAPIKLPTLRGTKTYQFDNINKPNISASLLKKSSTLKGKRKFFLVVKNKVKSMSAKSSQLSKGSVASGTVQRKQTNEVDPEKNNHENNVEYKEKSSTQQIENDSQKVNDLKREGMANIKENDALTQEPIVTEDTIINKKLTVDIKRFPIRNINLVKRYSEIYHPADPHLKTFAVSKTENYEQSRKKSETKEFNILPEETEFKRLESEKNDISRNASRGTTILTENTRRSQDITQLNNFKYPFGNKNGNFFQNKGVNEIRRYQKGTTVLDVVTENGNDLKINNNIKQYASVNYPLAKITESFELRSKAPLEKNINQLLKKTSLKENREGKEDRSYTKGRSYEATANNHNEKRKLRTSDTSNGSRKKKKKTDCSKTD